MNPIFPVSYSTLCPKALALLVSERYGFNDVDCNLITRGVGDTYLVTSQDEHRILRVYRSTHRSLPQIQEEVALLLALAKANVSISFPIQQESGEYIISLLAPEGKRHAVLFSYAEGQSSKTLDQIQLRMLGREMAKFHQISSTLDLGNSRRDFNLKTTLFKPLKMIGPALSTDPETYLWLQGIVGQAAEYLSQIDPTTMDSGYCHFDFLPKNYHFTKEKVTFFDFDFMGRGWLVNDIMSFWQHLELDVYTGRMSRQTADNSYNEFLGAYRKVRNLSKQELDAVPYLAIGFWLFYMGFHTTHDQFLSQSQPSQVKAYSGVIRHIVETYW